MYYVDIDLENKTSRPITTTISKGTVLEVKDLTSGVQCLVAERDVVVHLPPGRSVAQIPALCLNSERAPPSMNPGRLTPFAMTAPFVTQTDVWNRINKGV
jgi:hypothetical protein